jgi:hypothetical protein
LSERPQARARLCAPACALLLAVLCAPAAAVPEGPPPGVRGAGGLATRSVSEYLRLERELEDAIETRDAAGIDRLVDASFEWRSGAIPDPLSRDEWLRAERAAARHGARIRDLAVREESELVIVSFVRDAKDGATFVVDVWRRDPQRLVARYPGRPAPGAAPKRPSGRE